MKTQQYENIYQKSETKEEGSLLQAVEWNTLADAVTSAQTKINSLVEDVASASTPSSSSEPAATTGNITIGGQDNDSHMYLNSKGNLCIETTVNNVPNGKKGKINIEANDDIQIKPGDDFSIHAHHRAEGNRNEVSLKILTEDNIDEIPASFKINSGDITVTNKDCVDAFLLEIKDTYKKTPDYEFSNDPFAAQGLTSGNIYRWDQDNVSIFSAINVGHEVNGAVTLDMAQDLLSMGVNKTRVFKTTDNGTIKYYKFTRVSKKDGVTNINFEDAEGFGYLKVRAQSIDLRCEEHGGVALQPKGYDGSGNMNKIKFEHGGGDGLEFGTFNTEKTSIFTDEYRFNKNGVWKMATRTTEASDKIDSNDNTTALKYVKQADDFYDIINNKDPQTTTEDIIKAATAINGVQYNLYGSLTTSPTLKNNGVIVVKAVNNSTNKYLSVPSYNLSGTNGTYQNQMVNIAPISVGATPTVYEVGRCNILDLVKLVNYFKANNLGPWEASNTYDDPATISNVSSYNTWNSGNGHINAEEVEPSDEPISSPGANHNAGGITEG